MLHEQSHDAAFSITGRLSLDAGIRWAARAADTGIPNHSDHAPIMGAGRTVKTARPVLTPRMTFSIGTGLATCRRADLLT